MKVKTLVALGAVGAVVAMAWAGPAFGTGTDKTGSSEEIRLTLDAGMEEQRDELAAAVEDALGAALSCFSELGFEVAADGVIREAVFFADGDAARRGIASQLGVDPEGIPATFGGTIDGATLFVTSPNAFEGSFKELYGGASWSPDEYRKLLVHEIAHRAHAIVATELFGDEDGMGPAWFFEGLALHCAGQFPSQQPPNDPVDWQTLADLITKAEAGSLEVPFYPRYAWLFRCLSTSVEPAWMIRHAGENSFVEELAHAYTR